jgi:Fe2+ transport system protein FeoA
MATIESIEEHVLSAKLTDMGLYPGKKVTVVFKAPLGDPIAVDVDGYTLSLRRVEAALIEVI